MDEDIGKIDEDAEDILNEYANKIRKVVKQIAISGACHNYECMSEAELVLNQALDVMPAEFEYPTIRERAENIVGQLKDIYDDYRRKFIESLDSFEGRADLVNALDEHTSEDKEFAEEEDRRYLSPENRKGLLEKYDAIQEKV